MKRIILIMTLLAGMLQALAQQDPQYSLYMFNPLGVNPAYAGSREVLSAVLVHRSQWIGLEGAPETQTLALNMPLKNKRMGVGLQLVNDAIGPRSSQTFAATYAYRLKLGTGKLAFGLSAGMLNYNYNWDEIEYKQAEDAIPTTAPESFMKPIFDFGIYYNTKSMYIGAAINHINEAEFGLLGASDTVVSNAKMSANFIGTFGKAFIINENLVLKSSILFRLANNAGNLDFSSSLLIKNRIQFGFSLRPHALILLTEINLSKNLRMGIGYDIDRSDLTNTSSGSFEIFVGYDVGIFKSKVESPRYF